MARWYPRSAGQGLRGQEMGTERAGEALPRVATAQVALDFSEHEARKSSSCAFDNRLELGESAAHEHPLQRAQGQKLEGPHFQLPEDLLQPDSRPASAFGSLAHNLSRAPPARGGTGPP